MQQTDPMGWTPAQVSSLLERDLHARRLLREAREAANRVTGNLEAGLLTRARHFTQVVVSNLDELDQRLAEAED